LVINGQDNFPPVDDFFLTLIENFRYCGDLFIDGPEFGQDAPVDDCSGRLDRCLRAISIGSSTEDVRNRALHVITCVFSRFDATVNLPVVARVMGTEQKPLYRRLRRCLAALRQHLEVTGISWSMVHSPATAMVI